jgi:hypothetical protein
MPWLKEWSALPFLLPQIIVSFQAFSFWRFGTASYLSLHLLIVSIFTDTDDTCSDRLTVLRREFG